MKFEIPYSARRSSRSMKHQIPSMEARDPYSPSNKRRRIQNESFGYNFSKSSATAETQYRNFKRVSNSNSDESKQQEKEPRFEIDRCKKLQCSWHLKRLMLHPDGKDFKQPVDKEVLGSKVPELKPMEIIKSKLDKDFYSGTDEFAADIRLMFSNVMLYYPPKNEMYRRGKRLEELFEKHWKSLKERWESEKPKEAESKTQQIRKKIRIKSSKPPRSEKAEKGGEKCAHQVDEKKSEHFLDTILASQQNMLDFGRKAELQRKKEREAARMMIQKMERTIYIDDNMKAFKELEVICGRLLSHCISAKSNPLKKLGLFLKDDDNNANWDDETFNDEDL